MTRRLAEWLFIIAALAIAAIVVIIIVDHTSKNIDAWVKAQTAQGQIGGQK